MDNKKIRVAITHGDTNGIGYELIFKTFAEPEMLEFCTPIIYGSPKVAAYYRKAMNLPAQFSIIQKAEDAEDGRINLLAAVEEEVKVDMGIPTQESGEAAVKALDRAMTDYRNGLYDVLVTAPINNQNAVIEGFAFKGHKHYIETCLGEGKKGLSILCGGDLRIASVTEKIPFKDVLTSITKEAIIEKTKLFQQSSLPSTNWQHRASKLSVHTQPTISSAKAISPTLTASWPCTTTKPPPHSTAYTPRMESSTQLVFLSFAQLPTPLHAIAS